MILVAYRRTGGIVGTDDRVVVWADGLAQTSGRIFGAAEGRVDDGQMRALRDALRDWRSTKSPARSRAADVFVVTLCHDGHTVTADDASPEVPDAFARVRGVLESVAHRLARPEASNTP